MFEQTRAYRIRFQLPENQRGKVREIRTIDFDEDGIHVFEGTLEDYESRRRYLKNFGVLPLETPDVTIPKDRPIPRGVGKQKVANILGAKDDLNDVSEFKAKPDGAPVNPAPEGDRKPPADPGKGASGSADLRHGVGADNAPASATGPVPESGNDVGSEAEVNDADFDF